MDRNDRTPDVPGRRRPSMPAGRAFRAGLAAAGLLLSAAATRAQSDWADVAVPAYGPVAVLQGLYLHGMTPRAERFAERSAALVTAVRAVCAAGPAAAGGALPAARTAWRETATAWEALAAVSVGPVVERRTLRQIDFMPSRPPLIDRAIAAAPQGAKAMEGVGTPAKGLPGLEQLLWPRAAAMTASVDTPACRYAVEVAAEIDREAQALAPAFRSIGERGEDDWEEAAATAALAEFVNQWVGGIERLRWPMIEKPLRAGGGAAGALPRAASGSTVTTWRTDWQALRALTVFGRQGAASATAGAGAGAGTGTGGAGSARSSTSGTAAAGRAGPAPTPGDGLVPLETWLRGRGLNPLADKLVQTVGRVDAAMAAVPASGPVKAPVGLAVAKELAGLKRLAEAELAPALDVSLGFSDADGD